MPPEPAGDLALAHAHLHQAAQAASLFKREVAVCLSHGDPGHSRCRTWFVSLRSTSGLEADPAIFVDNTDAGHLEQYIEAGVELGDGASPSHMPAGRVARMPGEPKPQLPHLNEHRFLSMNHARPVVAGWVEDFNTARPHWAIGYMSPAAYAATLKPQRAPALRHLESSAPMPVATVALTRNFQSRIPMNPG